MYADGTDRFLRTPTHHTGANEGSAYHSPFFLVADIPIGHLTGTEDETLHAPAF